MSDAYDVKIVGKNSWKSRSAPAQDTVAAKTEGRRQDLDQTV